MYIALDITLLSTKVNALFHHFESHGTITFLNPIILLRITAQPEVSQILVDSSHSSRQAKENVPPAYYFR